MRPMLIPFVTLGDSRAQWGSIPLPVSLANIGMPGCSLHTNPLMTIMLVNKGGSADWSIGIPSVSNYVGLTLYAQGGVTSPSSNSLGIVLSNAAEIELGAR